MSFWDLNDGSTAESSTEYEMEGGNLEPIPNKTDCISAIEEAKWDDYDGDRFISLKWRVMRPDAYANRVVFQKVKVYGTSRDKDPKATADKAKRMLAAIDANAGGRLMKAAGEPTDEQLMSALTGKMMATKMMVWKMKGDDGEDKTGNWISAVAPAKGGAAKPVQAAAPVQQAAPAGYDFDDEDLPF